MSLYKQWFQDAYDENTGGFNKKVWDAYLKLEMEIYQYFLNENINYLKGSVAELAERFNMSPVYFVGFLDGINGALNQKLDIEQIEETTTIDIAFEWDTLYKKMVEYKAEPLYSLESWQKHFSEEALKELYLEQKKSKTIVKDLKVGRNDSCPCGSGKKYKKCCGA